MKRITVLFAALAMLVGCGSDPGYPVYDTEIADTEDLTGYITGSFEGREYGGDITYSQARPGYVSVHFDEPGFAVMHQIGFADLSEGLVDGALLCVGDVRGSWKYDSYVPGAGVDVIAVDTEDGLRVSYSYETGDNVATGYFDLPAED